MEMLVLLLTCPYYFVYCNNKLHSALFLWIFVTYKYFPFGLSFYPLIYFALFQYYQDILGMKKIVNTLALPSHKWFPSHGKQENSTVFDSLFVKQLTFFSCGFFFFLVLIVQVQTVWGVYGIFPFIFPLLSIHFFTS